MFQVIIIINNLILSPAVFAGAPAEASPIFPDSMMNSHGVRTLFLIFIKTA